MYCSVLDPFSISSFVSLFPVPISLLFLHDPHVTLPSCCATFIERGGVLENGLHCHRGLFCPNAGACPPKLFSEAGHKHFVDYFFHFTSKNSSFSLTGLLKTAVNSACSTKSSILSYLKWNLSLTISASNKVWSLFTKQ